MRRTVLVLISFALWLCSLPGAQGRTSAHRTSAVSKSAKASKKAKRTRSHRVRGQKKIDGDRTRQIQQALADAHYLPGPPSGKWDAATEDALRRFQADQGWQTKVVPDSRALIKLGLGPSQEKLINPESAMTSRPEAVVAGAKPAAPQK